MSGARGPLGGLRATLPDGEGGAAPAPPDARGGLAKRPVCPLGHCDGSGWIVGPEDIARPCECRERKIERARSRGVAATVPKRYRGVSFERPPLTEMARQPETASAVRDVRDFCARIDDRLAEGRGVWMTGGVGTGKTTLAMAVSKAAIDAGHTVAIYSLPRLLARIRRTFDSEAGEDSYFTFFNRLVSVDLLHLDDLGAENRTEWVLEQLYAIIDRRYEDQRSVVVTTNLPEHELEEQLGERVVSRLVEICGDPIKFPDAGDRRFDLRPI